MRSRRGGNNGGRQERVPAVRLAGVRRNIDHAKRKGNRQGFDIATCRRSQCRKFRDRLRFDAHCQEESADLDRRGMLFQQQTHGGRRFLIGQVFRGLLAFADLGNDVLHRERHVQVTGA